MSLASTVSETLIEALREIAITDLGFVDRKGNIRNYLPQYHSMEQYRDYFLAKVQDKTGGVHRVWAVEVDSDDFYYTSRQDRYRRRYVCSITGYYELGQQGEGRLLISAHLSKIQKVLLQMSTNLSGTVDRVIDGTMAIVPATIISMPPDLSVNRLVSMGIRFDAEKVGISEW